MLKKFIIVVTLFLIPLCATAKNWDGIEVSHKLQGIWVFKLNGKQVAPNIKPVVEYTTADNLFSTGNYALVVNGGFFDMKTKAPVSYVVIDNQIVENPSDNPKMMETLVATKRDEAVLNRSEFRILEDKKGKISYDIAPHFAEIPKNKTLKHSIQGGPLILPTLEWEKESFVTFDKETGKVLFESCDVTKRRPRTILGLKDNNIYIVLFTTKHEAALNEAYDFCKKKLKLEKVMALDGGGSTALNYRDIKIHSEGLSGRKVKSFLVVERSDNE